MENKALQRRLDSLEKTLNLIYKDREIQEDILLQISALKGKVATLEEEVKLLRERVDKGNKELSAETSELKDSVNEVKDVITN